MSHFKVGTKVALLHTSGQALTEWTVSKVREDGCFFVSFIKPDGSYAHSNTVWTPEGDLPKSRTGNSGPDSSWWIEVWSEKHDVALAQQKMIAEAHVNMEAVITWLKKLDVRSPTDRELLKNLRKAFVEDPKTSKRETESD